VPVNDPEELAFGDVVAVPMIRPEASRVVACTVPPILFWRSMVWTIRPEASRTTSRQGWAGDIRDKANESRTGRRSGFIVVETGYGGGSFKISGVENLMCKHPGNNHETRRRASGRGPRHAIGSGQTERRWQLRQNSSR
jgi:hypothetical protein